MDARVGFFVLAVVLGFGGVSYVIGLPRGAATDAPGARTEAVGRRSPAADACARRGATAR